MRGFARWRLAVRYADGYHPWTGGVCMAVVFGTLAFAPDQPDFMYRASVAAGLPAPLLAVAIGFVIGAAFTPAIEFAKYYWRAPVRAVEDLDERIAVLEEARAAQPSARIGFDYNARTYEVRLHVTNEGGTGDFCAPLRIDGSLESRIDTDAFGSWEHTHEIWARIGKGETRVLRIAQLDLSNFPFAQWCVYVSTNTSAPFHVRAMHTSVIGGSPDRPAPIITVELTVVSAPDALERIRPCVIALNAFGAEVLQQ